MEGWPTRFSANIVAPLSTERMPPQSTFTPPSDMGGMYLIWYACPRSLTLPYMREVDVCSCFSLFSSLSDRFPPCQGQRDNTILAYLETEPYAFGGAGPQNKTTETTKTNMRGLKIIFSNRGFPLVWTTERKTGLPYWVSRSPV